MFGTDNDGTPFLRIVDDALRIWDGLGNWDFIADIKSDGGSDFYRVYLGDSTDPSSGMYVMEVSEWRPRESATFLNDGVSGQKFDERFQKYSSGVDKYLVEMSENQLVMA